jgi:hypothetical protein
MSLLCQCHHHWLLIANRIEYKLCTLVLQCLRANAPRYLADHVILTSSVGRRRGLRSADIRNLEVPKIHLSIGDRASSITVARLPIHVCSTHTTLYIQETLINCFIRACVFVTFINSVSKLSGVFIVF